jgi:hypothetical protein
VLQRVAGQSQSGAQAFENHVQSVLEQSNPLFSLIDAFFE